MPANPTDRTTILAGVAALIEQAERHAVTPSADDRAKAISRREELQDLKRRVERGDIGDLTRTRAAEQAAFERGWKMAREAAAKVAAREASTWEGESDASNGAKAARSIEDAIGDLPMPERGT